MSKHARSMINLELVHTLYTLDKTGDDLRPHLWVQRERTPPTWALLGLLGLAPSRGRSEQSFGLGWPPEIGHHHTPECQPGSCHDSLGANGQWPERHPTVPCCTRVHHVCNKPYRWCQCSWHLALVREVMAHRVLRIKALTALYNGAKDAIYLINHIKSYTTYRFFEYIW